MQRSAAHEAPSTEPRTSLSSPSARIAVRGRRLAGKPLGLLARMKLQCTGVEIGIGLVNRNVPTTHFRTYVSPVVIAEQMSYYLTGECESTHKA